jgi:hypothetical protein
VVVVAAVAVAVETRTFIDHRSINKRNSHHMSSTHVLRHNLLGGLLSLTTTSGNTSRRWCYPGDSQRLRWLLTDLERLGDEGAALWLQEGP